MIFGSWLKYDCSKNRYYEISRKITETKDDWKYLENVYISKLLLYTLIAGEINVLENLLKKVYLVIKYLNGFQVTIENKDVKKYVVDNIIRQ